MKEITENIRKIAVRLLEEKKVDGVIGFRRGSLVYMTEPFMARTRAQAEELVFNSHCRMNLAAYLTPDRFKGEAGKLAVLAKGCDSRNIVTQILENRFTRDQVHVIGLPCKGMVDKTRLLAASKSHILDIDEEDESLFLTLEHGNKRLSKADLLQSNCSTCISRNPVLFDELAGEKVEELDLGEERFADVAKVEAMDIEVRKAYFSDLLSTCTRCYACRNACPLCYCPTCFVDEARPQWVGKSCDSTDVMTYHLVRAFHDAGRCTDCGACEAACPMDISMRLFTRKTIRDCKEAYDWEAGMDQSLRPALDLFELTDKNDFIR
ncbi:4Fe-4S binding protein [Desulfospira joergensenii]|uniref:4Fe-4S binding protein n=1 Tax=Desulfospira joergensenii TaxID=53329 RepID=UPI0003B5C8F5|nr:4Fe-4S binding protein [Desulfospira joergensenii]